MIVALEKLQGQGNFKTDSALNLQQLTIKPMEYFYTINVLCISNIPKSNRFKSAFSDLSCRELFEQS